jgi:hypothetical protein
MVCCARGNCQGGRACVRVADDRPSPRDNGRFVGPEGGTGRCVFAREFRTYVMDAPPLSGGLPDGAVEMWAQAGPSTGSGRTFVLQPHVTSAGSVLVTGGRTAVRAYVLSFSHPLVG